MFCGNCGAKNEDNAVFCGECGAKLNNTPAAETTETTASTETVETTDAPKANVVDDIVEKAESIPVVGEVVSKVDKKFRPLLLAAPIVVILLLVVIIGAGSGSYAKPMNNFLNLINKQTKDSTAFAYSLMPEFRAKLTKDMVKIMEKSDDYQDSIESANDTLEDNYDTLNDEFKKWKIKFEKKDDKKMDKDDLEEFQDACDDYFDEYIDSTLDNMEDILDDDDELEDYADMLDLSEKDTEKYIKKMIAYYKSFKDVKITDGYVLKGKFIVETDDDDFKSETVKLNFVKINGDWVYAGTEDYISLEDSDGMFNFILKHLNKGYLNQ